MITNLTRMGKDKTLLSRNHPVDDDPDDYYVTQVDWKEKSKVLSRKEFYYIGQIQGGQGEKQAKGKLA